jgi:hypothetical protein
MKKIEPNRQTHKEQKKDLNQKLNMFDRLPDQCYTCETAFDRKNKQQVQSWFVVVKNAEQTVKVYCPECWDKAQKSLQKMITNFNKGKENDVSEKSNL